CGGWPAHRCHASRRRGLSALHLYGDARPEGAAGAPGVAAAILGHMSRGHDGRFVIGWLYPDLMNIYGDRGNIVTLCQRVRWRGLDVKVLELGKGDARAMDQVDVFFFGGGQDREQALVFDDLLENKAVHLADAVMSGSAGIH